MTMMNDTTPGTRTRLNLNDIRIRYSSEGILTGADEYNDENTVIPWWAELNFADYPEDGTAPTLTPIGSVRGFLVDLDSGVDPYEALDALEADLERIGSALFQDGGIVEQMDILPSHAIIIDRVRLDSEYRGQRLGPRAVATAVRLLGRGRIAVAALIAQPDGWHEMGRHTLSVARQKVRHAWQGIGFSPFDDEVLWLDATDYDGEDYFAS